MEVARAFWLHETLFVIQDLGSVRPQEQSSSEYGRWHSTTGRTRVRLCYASRSRGLGGQRDARRSAALVHPLAQG